jgi:hypothetical protein
MDHPAGRARGRPCCDCSSSARCSRLRCEDRPLLLFSNDASLTVAGFRKAAYDILDRIEADALATTKPR